MSAFGTPPNMGPAAPPPPPPGSRLERAQDLLIARETIGLSPGEALELRELLAELGSELGAADVSGLGAAVDATRRAVATPAEEMPVGLRDRIVGMARPEDMPVGPIARIGPSSAADGGRGARASRLPWLVAAAAVLAAGVTIAVLAGRGGSGPSGPTIAEIDRAPDASKLAFAPKVAEYNGVTGEVVWSESLQRGYMRFKGLAANDPRVKQYQLWIVDPKRDQHPVDGGVFDVAQAGPGGEVVVPFRSVLHVDHPAAFAVTAEKPGGVVVSGGPLLLVAAR